MIKGSPPILDQFVFKVRLIPQPATIRAKMQANKQASTQTLTAIKKTCNTKSTILSDTSERTKPTRENRFPPRLMIHRKCPLRSPPVRPEKRAKEIRLETCLARSPNRHHNGHDRNSAKQSESAIATKNGRPLPRYGRAQLPFKRLLHARKGKRSNAKMISKGERAAREQDARPRLAKIRDTNC